MEPDHQIKSTLRADIVAVADLMEQTVTEGKEFTTDGVTFVVGALRQIATNAGILEMAQESTHRRLVAVEARIEALTIPDYLKQTRINIAIREGRAAGKVIDLREVFAREQDIIETQAGGLSDATEFAGESA